MIHGSIQRKPERSFLLFCMNNGNVIQFTFIPPFFIIMQHYVGADAKM